MPGHGRAAALGQQLKTVIELRLQPHQRQRIDLRRRQFNRQRQAVEAPADFPYGLEVLFAQGEPLLTSPGTADE
ncbi:hypothetical protein D9M73_280830 [compost metagenome]